MGIPKIRIVIEHEPADKAEDGEMTRGAVIGARANLPARYLDIVICEGEVTERDSNGAAIGWQWDLSHPRGETPFEVSVEPSLYEDAEDPARELNEGIEEWNVMFWLAGSVETALVLKAADVLVAAQRVKEEFPLCRIVRVEEAWLDEHPMSYLDENKIVLPVGGPRVQMERITEQ